MNAFHGAFKDRLNPDDRLYDQTTDSQTPSPISSCVSLLFFSFLLLTFSPFCPLIHLGTQQDLVSILLRLSILVFSLTDLFTSPAADVTADNDLTVTHHIRQVCVCVCVCSATHTHTDTDDLSVPVGRLLSNPPVPPSLDQIDSTFVGTRFYSCCCFVPSWRSRTPSPAAVCFIINPRFHSSPKYSLFILLNQTNRTHFMLDCSRLISAVHSVI